MKKQSELDEIKMLDEYQRKIDISISKAKLIRNNRFKFQERESSGQKEAVSIVRKAQKKMI